jgi:hypothetical protein
MDAPKRTPKGQCKRPGCDQPWVAKGLCKLHYNQKRLGTAGTPVDPGARRCTHPGCDAPINAKGLCNLHYQRQRAGYDMDAPQHRHRPGIGPAPKCAAETCPDAAQRGKFCEAHYRRHRLGQDMATPKRPHYKAPPGEAATTQCYVIMADGKQCDNPRKFANGMCPMHWARERAGTDLTTPKRVRANRRIDRDGYCLVRDNNGKWVAEHRFIMERLLGRKLLEGETVHHRNGQRADNTTDGPLDKDFKSGNLELWSESQPAGQRVADKIEWALALLAEYSPELLVKMAA